MRALVLLLLLAAPAGASGAWMVLASDPAQDAQSYEGVPGPSLCPALDLTGGSVTFDGSEYIWSFSVVDVTKTCTSHGEPFNARFPLYERDGIIRASVYVTSNKQVLTYYDPETREFADRPLEQLFDGNVATVHLPAHIGLTQDKAFRMSAFEDVSVTPAGCVVAACVYVFRDEMSS